MEQAIKKAIEGGWKLRNVFIFEKMIPDGILFHSENYDRIQITNWQEITSEPLFWQCLGKAMGWSEFSTCKWCGKTDCDHVEGFELKWLAHWHRFIDHLAEGKDAESFFNDLLK